MKTRLIIFDPFNRPYASRIVTEVREAIAAATRSNTAIYAVDPRGLDSPVADASMSELPGDLDLAFDNPYNRLLLSQTSLHVLSEETNGFAAVNATDFDDVFDRIVRDNSTYYLLGYYATNTERDGRFREIEVRLENPDHRVRARKGYVALQSPEPSVALTDAVPGTTDEMREVLSTPISVSGLAMHVSGVPFVGAVPNASVAVIVEVDGTSLSFAERDGLFANTLELSLLAIDRRGEIMDGDRQEAAMTLRPETYHAVASTGVRLVSRLELPPGQFQLRIGARETGAGAVGSVVYHIEVPDFRNDPLSMSGLALTSQHAALMPTAQPDEILGRALPAQPTTTRNFSTDDVLVVFAEVYDNESASRHTVDITTTLRAVDGCVVFQRSEERSSDDLDGARSGYGNAALIPLADMAPGEYVLMTEARSRLRSAATASGQLGLTIRQRINER